MGLCSPHVLQYKNNLLVKKVSSGLPPAALRLILKGFHSEYRKLLVTSLQGNESWHKEATETLSLSASRAVFL